MAFNDGDPIDAAQLSALETTLAELRSRIPQLGSSTTNIAIDQSVVQTVVVPKIYGGITLPQKLSPGNTVTFKVDYSAASFSAKPTSLIATPVRGGGSYTGDHYIVSSSVTASGAIINAFLPKGTSEITVQFYFLAIQHS
jgi:hypothetical protein